MKAIQLRDAKARLSVLVHAAERGEAVTITRHGKAAAVLVSVEAARRLYPERTRSFAGWLTSLPHALDIERDKTPIRPVKFD